MKKILAFMLTVVMILVCFTGCMYGEDRIEIKEDGTIIDRRLSYEEYIKGNK